MHNILITLFTFSILVSCVKRNPTVEGMYINIGGEPTTLNPITSTDGYSSSVQAYSLEYLVTHDIDTYELKPALATSWKISPDKTQFEFKLRPGVKWHDGKPLTAEDVKFSFDVIFDDRYNTAAKRPYYEG